MQFRKFVRFAHNHHIDIVPKRRYVGILFTLFAWFMLALATVFFSKSSISTTIPFFVGFFFQFISASFFYTTLSVLRGSQSFKLNEPWLVLFRGVLGISTYYLYAYSKIWAKTVDNSVLLSTEAIFVPLILSWILKKKYSFSTWIGVGVGLIGVGFLTTFNIKLLSLAGLTGISSGALLAIIIILTSYIVHNDGPVKIALYQSLIGLFASGLLAIFQWETPSLGDAGLLMYSGLLYGLALFLFLDSFYYTEPHILAMLSYSLVFFTELTNWVINQKTPTKETIYGFLFIFFGGLAVILNSYRDDRKKINR